MTGSPTLTVQPDRPVPASAKRSMLGFEDTLAAFLRALDGKNRSPLTRSAYRTDLRQFFAWLAHNTHAPTPAQVTRADVTEYLAFLAGRKLTGVTRARKLAALREFFRFLVERELLAKSPADGVETPKRERHVRPWLRPDQYRALLTEAAPNPRDFAILQVFLQTGVRVSELCALTLEDLDFERREVTVHGKGQAERTIPLNKKCRAALQNYFARRPHSPYPQVFLNKEGRPLSQRMVKKLVATYRRRAGIAKRVSCHTLRHTFGSTLAAKGVSPFVLQRLLGHAKLDTTMLYVHLATDSFYDIMEAVSL
ncbi:MAG: hypothetical protein CL878_03570 [Dehalococcoidia bacterium]|nr:hypothetical protein [Dehalococcoidia bacterium]